MDQLTTGSSKRWKYQLVQEHAGQNLDEQPFKIRSHNTIERFEEAHSLPVILYFLIIIIIIMLKITLHQPQHHKVRWQLRE